jgi:mRNA interferase MazF
MTRAATIEPWQVWLADFGTPTGSEQGGIRPTLIVGSEDHCRFPIQMALVVPLTTGRLSDQEVEQVRRWVHRMLA